VAELAVAGRPSVLVPLPGAIDDHQTGNARALELVGAALLAPQPAFQPESLVRIVTELLTMPGRLEKMAAAARTQARADAASRLADMIESLMTHETTHETGGARL
jgi:UDP-N-acetylglucosamine--N-acetylmuramyl-(pentapeptide) pyrophosphoryl-undecaprenol N-acetylglucosamine transferase